MLIIRCRQKLSAPGGGEDGVVSHGPAAADGAFDAVARLELPLVRTGISPESAGRRDRLHEVFDRADVVAHIQRLDHVPR